MNFYRREIIIDGIILLLGLLFSIIPGFLWGEITSAVNIIFVSVGCSLIASGITSFLSFVYREKATKLANFADQIGLIDIDNNVDSKIVTTISSAKKYIYYSSQNSPYRLISENIDIFKKLQERNVKMKILINKNGNTNQEELILQHCVELAKSLNIEFRITNISLFQMIIVDEKTFMIDNRLFYKNHFSPFVFTYKAKNSKNSFHDYQRELFEQIWIQSEVLNI